MRKFGLVDIIMAKGMSFPMKKNLLEIPTIYVCDSVRDFEVEKSSIDGEYSSVIFQSVHLEPELTYDGKLCKYMHDDNRESLGFWISDNHVRLNVLWPLINTQHVDEAKMEGFIDNPRYVDYVVSIYNKKYDNNFVLMVGEDSYKNGIEKVMQEIWSAHNLE